MSEEQVLPFLQLSPSSRAKCRKCKKIIEKNDLRVGFPYSFRLPSGEVTQSYRWYHIDCLDRKQLAQLKQGFTKQDAVVTHPKYQQLMNQLEKDKQLQKNLDIFKQFLLDFAKNKNFEFSEEEVLKMGKMQGFTEKQMKTWLKTLYAEGDIYRAKDGIYGLTFGEY